MASEPGKLLRQTQDIAALFHVGPAAVRYLARTYDDFPPPVAVVRIRGAHARLWDAEAIDAWGAAHGYLGGRRRNSVPPEGPPRAAPEAPGPRYALPNKLPRRYALRTAR